MREIKFKAYIKSENKIVDVFSLLIAEEKILYINPMIDLTTHDIDMGMTLVPYNNCILLQYTGLKDKNGTEIYEGDLGRYECASDLHEVIFGYYKNLYLYDDSTSGYGFYLRSDHAFSPFWPLTPKAAKEYEIIGNIHTHTNLMENK